MNRRGLIIGLASVIAAPAIVRAESLMKIAVMRESIAYIPPSPELVEALYQIEVIRGRIWKMHGLWVPFNGSEQTRVAA